MLKCALALGLVLGLCGLSHAQDVPRVEVFGGYSYLNGDVSAANPILNLLGLSSVGDRLSLNGWDASASVNFNRWVGVEADLSGHYKGDCEGLSGLTCKDLAFMGGPRITYRVGKITAFGHGLFGGDTLSASTNTNLITGASDVSASLSNTSFALAAGGGVDYAVTNRISVRLGQADYFLTRHFNDIGAPNQNNFRVSAGIVFTFGGTHEVVSRPASRSAGFSGASEAALLGVFGYPADNGFAVTSVRDGSPAAQAGIEPDDIVTAIDARPMHTSGDIESAIATSQTGTVRVSFLIKGAWLTEKDVRIR
jgi:opacity protein-like surface antigen